MQGCCVSEELELRKRLFREMLLRIAVFSCLKAKPEAAVFSVPTSRAVYGALVSIRATVAAGQPFAERTLQSSCPSRLLPHLHHSSRPGHQSPRYSRQQHGLWSCFCSPEVPLPKSFYSSTEMPLMVNSLSLFSLPDARCKGCSSFLLPLSCSERLLL